MKILAARLNWSSRSSLSAHWWTDLVASSTRWRAVCSSREVGGIDIGLPRLVGLGRHSPGFLRGVGRTAGAFLGLLNQPSSDGETDNVARAQFVPAPIRDCEVLGVWLSKNVPIFRGLAAPVARRVKAPGESHFFEAGAGVGAVIGTETPFPLSMS